MSKIIKIKESMLNKILNESESEMKEMSKISSDFSKVQWWPIVDKSEPSIIFYADGKQISVINRPEELWGTEGSRSYDYDVMRNLAMLMAEYPPEEIKIEVASQKEVDFLHNLANDKDFIKSYYNLYVRKFDANSIDEINRVKPTIADVKTFIRRNVDLKDKRIGVSKEGDFSQKGGTIIGQIHTQYIYGNRKFRLNEKDLLPANVAETIQPTVTALFYLTDGITPEEFKIKHAEVLKEIEQIAEIIYFIKSKEVPKYVDQAFKMGIRHDSGAEEQAVAPKTKMGNFNESEYIRRKMYPIITNILQSPDLVSFFYKNLVPPIMFTEGYRPSAKQSDSSLSKITTGAVNFISYSTNEDQYMAVRKYFAEMKNQTDDELEKLKSQPSDSRGITNDWRDIASSLWDKLDIKGIVKTYHLPRQWNTQYSNWEPTRKNANAPTASKTKVYKLDREGYVPENLDVTIKSEFGLAGQLVDSTWVWRADFAIMAGRKTSSDRKIKNMTEAFEPISVTTETEVNVDNLMNENRIWQSLTSLLLDLKKQIMSLSGKNFELGRMLAQYDRTVLDTETQSREDERLYQVQENKIEELANKILKEIYEKNS